MEVDSRYEAASSNLCVRDVLQRFVDLKKQRDLHINHIAESSGDDSMKSRMKSFFTNTLSLFRVGSTKGGGTGFAGTVFDGMKMPRFSSVASAFSSGPPSSSSSSTMEDLDEVMLQTLQSLSNILSKPTRETHEERQIFTYLVQAISLHKSLICYLMSLSTLPELMRCPALYKEIFSFFSLLSLHSTYKEILVETSLSSEEKEPKEFERGESYYSIIENVAINADMYLKVIEGAESEQTSDNDKKLKELPPKTPTKAEASSSSSSSSSSSTPTPCTVDKTNVGIISLLVMVLDSWTVIKSNCEGLYTQKSNVRINQEGSMLKKEEKLPSSSSSSSSLTENTHTSPWYTGQSEFIKYTPSQEEQSTYESQMSNRFQVVPLLHQCKQGRAVYSFMDKVEETAHAVIPNKQERLSRIAREITELRSNLPVQFSSTIHVICDEERFDVLKAVIIGPHDTPYANGIFEFDIFLPTNYPSSPPLVKLITTGKGTVRFNPNLYACGKVCLSLLGTWHGPSWDKNASSILQVLVSIQSLILVSDPYFNEPGYEGLRGTTEGNQLSASYNCTIRDRCLVEAIFNSMLYPPPLFEQTVKLHFKYKCKYLLHQLDHWGEMCEYTWSRAKSGSQYIDSYIGVSESLVVRAKNFSKVLNTTKKRLEKIKEKTMMP